MRWPRWLQWPGRAHVQNCPDEAWAARVHSDLRNLVRGAAMQPALPALPDEVFEERLVHGQIPATCHMQHPPNILESELQRWAGAVGDSVDTADGRQLLSCLLEGLHERADVDALMC